MEKTFRNSRYKAGQVVEGKYRILGITNIVGNLITYLVSVLKGLDKGELIYINRKNYG